MSCAKRDVPMSHTEKKNTFFIKKEKENRWGEYTDSIPYVNKILGILTSLSKDLTILGLICDDVNKHFDSPIPHRR